MGNGEAYGIARQSTGAYVTAGYGRSAAIGHGQRRLSFRCSATGVFDTTYAASGIFEKDLASNNDRGRNIVALPDDRLLIAGSATPTTAADVDGMVMILTPNGALDTTFNTTGYKTYKFDATNDRPDERSVRRRGVAERHVRGRRRLPQRGQRRRHDQRRRRPGHHPARRDGHRVRGGGAVLDHGQRPVLER